MSKSVERFTSRVEDYAKYRPGYPVEIVELLKRECGLTPDSIIADIGSGTGKSFEMFLANGNVVFGVEPNASMRAVAEDIFKDQPRFRSIEGSAESTTLPESSIDLIVAGQAFHWFDPVKTREEWVRILKPGGWAVLIWNERELQTTPFLEHYEKLLLEFGTDYKEIRHEHAQATVEDFFAPDKVTLESLPNTQVFDFDGLRGRVRSASYTPEPDHPRFEPMMRELKTIFDKHQQNGHVNFDYQTRVFYGRLSKTS
ncbi:MAG TPA: class I SAM-dependent methyltransferase [Pyrinomonadaceae bacterium]|nr:class I SAM-dependent methyltransferase [Pyrinomonadaceae bacterium]